MLLQQPVPNPIIESFTTIAIVKPAAQPKPEPKLYTIVEGDSLTKIAEATQSTVDRLWDANPQLTDPNLIEPSQELKIPNPEEVLTDRPMPAKIEVANTSSPTDVRRSNRPSGGSSVSSSGNTFYWGQCVWYLKNLRPEIPNSWSNASNWYSRAKADGWATGSTPQVGAIAWATTGSHVAMVTNITSTTVTVTEMNAKGVGVISSRTTPISQWLYIY